MIQEEKTVYRVGDTLPNGWKFLGLSPRTGKAYSLEPKDIALLGPAAQLAAKKDETLQLNLTPQLVLGKAATEYSVKQAIKHTEDLRNTFNDQSIRLPVYSEDSNEPMDIYNKVGLCDTLDPSGLGLETDEDHGYYFVLQDSPDSDDWQRVYRLDGKDVKEHGVDISFWSDSEWFRSRESNQDEREQVRCVRDEPDLVPADPAAVQKISAIEQEIKNTPGGLFQLFSYPKTVKRLTEEKLKLELGMAFHYAGQNATAEAVKQDMSSENQGEVVEQAVVGEAEQEEETKAPPPVVRTMPDLPDPFSGPK